jgi:hypothetical protein
MKELEVWCPNDDPASFTQSFRALYFGRGLGCFGDETTAFQHKEVGRRPGKNGEQEIIREWVEEPCDIQKCPYAQPGGYAAPGAAYKASCKLHMKCAFRLDNDSVPQVGPFATLRTTSVMTHANITDFLERMRSTTGGYLRGIPLMLVLHEVEFGNHTVEVLRLEHRGGYPALIEQLKARRQLDKLLCEARGRDGVILASAQAETPPMNMSPIDETEDEQAETQQEFHSEEEGNELSWDAPGGRPDPLPPGAPDEIPFNATEEEERAATPNGKVDLFADPPEKVDAAPKKG